MLRIFNDLKPFFENNYKRLNIREYGRVRKISPPSASKLLEAYYQEILLVKEKDKNYIYYSANKNNRLFIDLSRSYWMLRLKESGLIDFFEKELISPIIILFGSFSKAEIKETSDIDIAIFTISDKKINLDEFRKKLKRDIQLFIFKNRNSVKNKDLLSNILNGYILHGEW